MDALPLRRVFSQFNTNLPTKTKTSVSFLSYLELLQRFSQLNPFNGGNCTDIFYLRPFNANPPQLQFALNLQCLGVGETSLRIKMRPILGIISLIFVAFLFQNCSKVNFEEKVEEVSSLEADMPSKIANLKLDPLAEKKNPIEFIFYLDVSYSNVTNIKNTMGGIKNFLKNLPKEAVAVRFYYLCDNQYKLMETAAVDKIVVNSMTTKVKYTYSINPPALETDRANFASDAEFESSLNQILASLDTKLNSISDGQKDSIPSIHSELATLLSVRKNNGSNHRMVNIIVTDEDVSDQKVVKSYKWKSYTEVKVYSPERKYIQFPAEMRYKLEGTNNYGWKSEDLVSHSFTECTESNVNTAIRESPEFRKTENSVSGCRNRSAGGDYTGSQVAPGTQIAETWTDEVVNIDTSLLTVTDYFKKLNDISTMPQTFFGIFSTQTAADKKGPDQEISVFLNTFVQSIAPKENIHLESILTPNFSAFANKVSDFKERTENNRISIAQLNKDAPQRMKVKVLRLALIPKGSSNRIEITNFKTLSDDILINQSGIELNNGADVELEYTYIY